MTSALVLVGGDIASQLNVMLPVHDDVIAADSGLQWAKVLDVSVDLVVGDMDSVDPALLEDAQRNGTSIDIHPAAKDQTDMELALQVAIERGASSITVVGGGGGRLDHLLGNLALLASQDFAGVAITAHLPPATVTVVRDRRYLHGAAGDYVSLFAMPAPARGVTTSGLRWELRDGELSPSSTRGVSNELLGTEAWVEVGQGVLLAVQPGRR